jgi:hypothetical protein
VSSSASASVSIAPAKSMALVSGIVSTVASTPPIGFGDIAIHISRVVTISITAEAFAAIEATLPKGTKGEARRQGPSSHCVAAWRDRQAQGDARRGRELQQRNPADR